MGKLEGKIALIIPILWINSAFKKKLSLRTIVKQSCIVRDCFVAALLAMTALIYAQSNNRIGITGGNSGIGLATAKQFVNEGAYVFITGRRDPELAAAVKEIGRNVTGVKWTREESFKNATHYSQQRKLGKHRSLLRGSWRRIHVTHGNKDESQL